MSKFLEPRPGREENTSAYLGGGVIKFYGKPSTKTRLHELGHKVLGHEPGLMALNELIDRELDAESYAYRAMDKPLTYKIGISIVCELVQDWGLSPSEASGLVERRLAARGIKVSRRARQDLNWFAHGLQSGRTEVLEKGGIC